MIAISVRRGLIAVIAALPMMVQADDRLRDVPVAITAISGEQLEAQPLPSLTDLQAHVPGITIESGSGGRGTGISIRGIGNDYSNVLINGIRYDSLFDPGGVAPVPGTSFIPNIDIERVEVLRGPQGTLFGRNAPGGVINIVTRGDPQYSGNYGSYTLDAIQNTLNEFSFALQSPKDCDATHGTPQPSWSLFADHDYGMPEWATEYDMYFGMTREGFLKAMKDGFDSPGDAGSGDTPPTAPDAADATPTDPADTPETTDTNEETPGSSGTPAPQDPFERYPYPADYMFDFSECPEKKERVLQLIDEREAAGVNAIVLADRFRSPARTTAEKEADRKAREEFWALRRAKNEELRAYWHGCGESEADPEAAANTVPDASHEAPAHKFGSYSSIGNDFALDFSVRYSERGEDDSVEDLPAPNIGIDVVRNDFGIKFGLPLGDFGMRDTESYASQGSTRVFTNQDGKAGVQVADGEIQLQTGMGAWPTNYWDKSPFAQRSAGEGVANPGEDWQLRFNWSGGDSMPRIGMQFNYEPIDGAVQRFPGMGWGNGGRPLEFRAPQISEMFGGNIPFNIGEPFSVSGDLYLPYSWAEFDGLDPTIFNSIPGQGGWTNDFCGDEAQAPEEVGYTLSQFSPVQSVADQWAMQNVGLAKGGTRLPDSAQPVVVAVIDTGIDWNHADFSWDNLWRNEDEVPDNGIDDDQNGYVDDIIGWDFMADHNKPWDNDGHGTFVAGVIAATQNNDIGIDGINANARIMALKAMNSFGRTRASYLARAIVYAADNGANIINLSVSGPGFPTVVQEAVNYANEKGVLVIQAAGNVADNVDNAIPTPIDGTMIIAASGLNRERAAFSNFGSRLSLAAPGVDVVSLRARMTDFMYNSGETSYPREDAFLGEDRRYYRSTGTSFSAAIVSGIASLLWSDRPELTNVQVQRMLEQSAADVGNPGKDQHTGFGIVDAAAALQADPEFFVDAHIAGVLPLGSGDDLVIAVAGRANADQFKSAKLEVGASEDPIEWVQIGDEIDEPTPKGVLGTITPEDVRGARVWTVRVVVEHANGKTREHRHSLELR